MAFLVNGTQIVDDSRSIDAIGISTFESLRATGVVTSVNMEVTGVSTVANLQATSTVLFDKDDSGTAGFRIGSIGQEVLSIETGTDLGDALAVDTALPTQLAVKTYVDDAVSGAVGGGGDFSGANANLTGSITVGTTGSFGETVTFDSADSGVEGFRIGTSGQEILSIDTAVDLGAGASSDTALPTQAAVKSYVDTQFADNNTFDFQVQGGTEQALDLTGDQIDFIGGNNLTASLVVSGVAGDETYALTFDLDNDVTIGNNLDITGALTFGGAGESVSNIVGSGGDLAASGANDNDNTIPTFAAVLDVVSSGVSGGAPTIQLDDSGDSPGTYYIPMSANAGTGAQESLVTDAQLYFDPSTGRLNAEEYNSLSDIRFKENIELIEAPLEKIEALRGVTYDWKRSGNASAGIIAQEVQAVMPELISEQEDRLTVNYNGLTGLLIEAVKELSAEVAALKAAQ